MLHQSDLVSQEIRDKMMITLSMQYIHIMNDTISTWVNNHLDVMTNICYVNFGFANDLQHHLDLYLKTAMRSRNYLFPAPFPPLIPAPAPFSPLISAPAPASALCCHLTNGKTFLGNVKVVL